MLSYDNSDPKGKDGIVTPSTLCHLQFTVLEARLLNSELVSEGKCFAANMCKNV